MSRVPRGRGRGSAGGRDRLRRGAGNRARLAVRLLRRRQETASSLDLLWEAYREVREAGWEIRSPLEVSIEPEGYRRYIQGSKGEFSAAKGMNVELRSGWFSDRSVCYLASGRPVLAQETGFSRWLPTGEGLLSFKTTQDALAGVEAIAGDYPRHAKAARAIAEEFFDSDKVLTRLLEQVGMS